MIVGVDVDDVALDLMGEWLRRYNADHNDFLTKNDIKTWDIFNHVKCGHKIYDYLKHSDLYDNIQPVEGAVEAIKALRDIGDRIVYVTSCVRGPMFDAKWGALIRNGLLSENRVENDYIGATDKTLIKVDVMIDDKPETIKAIGMRGKLFKRPWNDGTWTWPRLVQALGGRYAQADGVRI